MAAVLLAASAMRLYKKISILAIACAAAGAQAPDYSSQSLTGAFLYEVKVGPNGGITYPLLNSAPGYGIDYGFRPRRWLMLDSGFEQIVRPIGSAICCEYSTNADDQLYLVPFGARYVWEPQASRLRFTAGGGGAYLNHYVGIQNGDVVGFSGWGGQFVASGEYALTRSGRLRLGVTARYYIAAPKPSVSFGPGNPHDHLRILTIGPAVTFSFR
jgi:hypothetical protein